MSNLTITFQQMFLLVNRSDGATVLMPSLGHTATLSGAMFPVPITLVGVDVLVRRDGLDYTSDATLRTGARYLPYLDYVFHTEIVPLPETSAAAIPNTLNARAFVAGGYLTEIPASDLKVAALQWNFVKPSNEITLTQALTDRVLFTLPLVDGVVYELVLRGTDSEQAFPIPAGGADLTLLNTDLPTSMKAMRQAPVDGWHTLKEYALLYNLTTASTMETLYPYPTAYTQGLGGTDQPICGGGQTDGDDDPPAPPQRQRR